MSITQTRISKITIGRLFNLGSYEHVRYELTVEIPEGESAAKAIVGIERILAGMKPIKDEVESEAQLAHGARRIEDMKTMSADDWQRQYGHAVGTREEIIARYEASHRENLEKRAAAVQRAKTARLLFDNLHGAEQFKDAKLDWDLDNDY